MLVCFFSAKLRLQQLLKGVQRGTSVASTTYHLRSTWPGLAMNVVLFMISPI